MSNSRNQHTRLELLIVLDYLLNHSNANHIPQQKDYLDFAKKTYKYTFKKRQHIREILDHLDQLKQKYPSLLPFTIQSFDTGQRKKYYVTSKGLSEDEIKVILSALQHNVYTPKETALEVANRFLPLITNHHDVSHFREWMVTKNKEVQKVSKRTIKMMIRLDDALNKRAKVELTLLTKPDKALYFNGQPYLGPSEIVKGVVYRLYDQANQPYVLIINQDTGKIRSCKIANITELITYDFEDDVSKMPKPETYFQDPQFASPEANVKAAANPYPEGNIATITFRFLFSNYAFSLISESFHSYFKYQMPFKERVEKLVDFLLDKNENVNPKQEVKVIYVQFKANTMAYVKWATSYDIARLIETRTPTSVIKDIYQHFAYLAKLNQINHE